MEQQETWKREAMRRKIGMLLEMMSIQLTIKNKLALYYAADFCWYRIGEAVEHEQITFQKKWVLRKG